MEISQKICMWILGNRYGNWVRPPNYNLDIQSNTEVLLSRGPVYSAAQGASLPNSEHFSNLQLSMFRIFFLLKKKENSVTYILNEILY